MIVARPLDRFPLIRAHHTEDAREALSKIYSNDMRFEPLERGGVIDITVNNCQLTQTGLNYTGYGAGVRAHFPGSKFVTLSFPTRGNGSTVIAGTERLLGPRRGLVMPADAGFAATLNADFEHVVLRLDPTALQAKLAALLGAPVDGPMQFEPLLEFSRVNARLLRGHFFFLVDMVGSATVPVPRLLQTEFEQALMVMFLYACRHRYSRLLDEDALEATPADVRRAEGYIEANWQRAITLEDLAAVTGVSALSLFRSFKAYRGYSPTQFAEHVRKRMRSRH
jgi:AraC-binding-like domain